MGSRLPATHLNCLSFWVSILLSLLHASCSQVLNGHFVHYFAPKELPAVPKNVVFVIDTSASMLGKKMRQVKCLAYVLGLISFVQSAEEHLMFSFPKVVR